MPTSHLTSPDRHFWLEFEMEYKSGPFTYQTEVVLEPVIDSRGHAVYRSTNEDPVFDKWCSQFDRSLSLYEAVHIFKEELPALCYDHIKSDDNAEHWRSLMNMVRNEDHLEWTERLRRAKLVPIRVVIEKFGLRIRMNKINCPFHEERSASLHIYEQTNTWKCYGCGLRGDQIEFIRAKTGCDFSRALDYLNC